MTPRRSDHDGTTLAVGNGAGFWGDNLDAPYLLARDGRIDVLTLEYLAELTMAILSHLRSKDRDAGYVTDFPELVERLAPILAEKQGLCDRHQRRRAEPAVVRGPLRRDPRRQPGRGRCRSESSPATTCWTRFPMDAGRGSTSLTSRPANRSRAWPTGWSPPTSTSEPGRSPTHCEAGCADRGDRPGRRCFA